MSACAHPKEQRTLLYGFDVVCGDCQETVGRVALFSCAVLEPEETRALLELVTRSTERRPRALRDAIKSLERASS